ADAVEELATALARLQPATLLFLTELGRVTARRDGVQLCELTRMEVEDLDAGASLVTIDAGHPDGEPERYLTWTRRLDAMGAPEQAVEIAFRVLDSEGTLSVTPLPASPLVVTFPTEKETFLGFLVQGPFRTTPARDNVLVGDDWNRDLV